MKSSVFLYFMQFFCINFPNAVQNGGRNAHRSIICLLLNFKQNTPAKKSAIYRPHNVQKVRGIFMQFYSIVRIERAAVWV